MPLARLSIKSALHIAKSSVAISRSPTAPWWMVRVDHGGSKSVYTGEWTKADAQAKKRDRRIFLALVLLEFDEVAATRMASAAADDARPWFKVVAAAVERREMVGAR